MNKILIIEDDIDIQNLLNDLLINNGYKISSAYSGTEALLILEKETFDLILLDLMLPGLNGEEIIEKMKNTPIIVMSAKLSPDDKVECLLKGANDYITKPFNTKELLARIEVQLRNNKISNQSLKYKSLELLDDNRTLKIKDKEVVLTKTEYAILKQLIIKKGGVITKKSLLDLICEDTPDCDENSLKVHISNIRIKIKKITNIDYIEAVWGIGFKLKD